MMTPSEYRMFITAAEKAAAAAMAEAELAAANQAENEQTATTANHDVNARCIETLGNQSFDGAGTVI